MNSNTDLQAFPIFRAGTHTPMHGTAMARNMPCPLSWGQGDLSPCGGWGSAPRALGENKMRGMRPRMAGLEN